MLIFREESHILRDVNVFYRNKRCPRADFLECHLCFVTERAIRFRVELELYRFGFQLFSCVSLFSSTNISPLRGFSKGF